MSGRIGGRLQTICLVAWLCTLLASSAQAIPWATLTLQEVIDGDGFSTASGLVFDDFNATIGGVLADQIDAADIHVVIVNDGFLLAGPMMVAGGDDGAVVITYSVSAGPEHSGIGGALLFSNGVAFGAGAKIAVDEHFTANGQPVGALSTFFAGGAPGARVSRDSIVFDETHLELQVVKEIFFQSAIIDAGLENSLERNLGPFQGLDGLYDSLAAQGSARVWLIAQRFDAAPEPGTFLLLGLGLAGLALQRRHHRS